MPPKKRQRDDKPTGLSPLRKRSNNDDEDKPNTSSSLEDGMTPYAKNKMLKRGIGGADICRGYREALYRKTNLGIHLADDNDELIKFVRQQFEKNNGLNGITEPSRKALQFTTTELFRLKRSKLEGRAGTSTIGQCNNSIGKKNPIRIEINNHYKLRPWKDRLKECVYSASPECFKPIRDWERQHCWLCGLPLKTTTADLGIDCEHKLAMLIMMLVGAGLKKTKPRGSDGSAMSKLIQDSAQKKTFIKKNLRRNSNIKDTALELPAAWKILVRGEGYAWSHAYCNQYKSQIPFISLKYNNTNNSKPYEYIIEINNIIQYLAGMFEIKHNDIKKIFPWYDGPNMAKQENDGQTRWIKQYGPPAQMKTSWQHEMGLPTRARPSGTNPHTKEALMKNAFNNIITMLIPTYFLLNMGNDINGDVVNKGKKLFENITQTSSSSSRIVNHDRTFVNIMEKIPMRLRLQDNIHRILGWMTKGNMNKFTEWLGKLDYQNREGNPIMDYIKINPGEKQNLLLKDEIQDHEGVLKMFRGASLAVVPEEEDEGQDDIVDLIEEGDDNLFEGAKKKGKYSPRTLGSSMGGKRSRRRKRKRKRTRRKKRKKKRSKKKRRRKKRTRRRR